MRSHKRNAKIVVVAVLSAFATFAHSFAVDMANAAGILAGIQSLAVQAESDLANAASSGDVDAIAAASTRSRAVNYALVDAQKAFAAAEKAVAAEDEEDAAKELEGLVLSQGNALNAFENGATAGDFKLTHRQWIASQKRTGGGPNKAADAPDYYRDLTQDSGLQSFYASTFNIAWSAGGFVVGVEDDVTPQ